MEPHQPKPNVNAATLSVASQVVDAVIQTHRAGIEPTPPSHEYAALLASVVADAKEAGVSAVGAEMGDAATRSRVRSVVENLARRKTALPNGVTHDRLIRDVVAEITGAGAIELALDEVDVTSIFVSPSGRVSVGRGDAAGPSPYWFSSSSAVSTAVDRLLKIAGASRVADQAYVEAVLGDGSRLTVVYAPGASAPSVAIERASKRAPAMADLVAREMCSSAVVTVLQRALEARRNVIVVGPRGSGRSTLVAALASHSANHGERVVALEARAELSAAHRDVVSVPIGKDGKRAVEVAAAMRPQRMIFAHVDDHSVSAFVGNLVTGAEGVIAVLDGASLHNALQRAAGAVAASAGSSLSKDDVLQQIAASRPLLVQLTRLGDGSARVVSVAEASESAGKMLQIDELYRLQLGPQNDRGRLSAQWPSSGHTPSFLR
jgi:pilus assembly protein CpaF